MRKLNLPKYRERGRDKGCKFSDVVANRPPAPDNERVLRAAAGFIEFVSSGISSPATPSPALEHGRLGPDLIAAAATIPPSVNLATFNGANSDDCSLQMETVRFCHCLPNRVDVENGNPFRTVERDDVCKGHQHKVAA